MPENERKVARRAKAVNSCGIGSRYCASVLLSDTIWGNRERKRQKCAAVKTAIRSALSAIALFSCAAFRAAVSGKRNQQNRNLQPSPSSMYYRVKYGRHDKSYGRASNSLGHSTWAINVVSLAVKLTKKVISAAK